MEKDYDFFRDNYKIDNFFDNIPKNDFSILHVTCG